MEMGVYVIALLVDAVLLNCRPCRLFFGGLCQYCFKEKQLAAWNSSNGRRRYLQRQKREASFHFAFTPEERNNYLGAPVVICSAFLPFSFDVLRRHGRLRKSKGHGEPAARKTAGKGVRVCVCVCVCAIHPTYRPPPLTLASFLSHRKGKRGIGVAVCGKREKCTSTRLFALKHRAFRTALFCTTPSYSLSILAQLCNAMLHAPCRRL
ncbi:hypothetical protein F4678DRAFT_143483 [Xylaria arbuscula]|nr:hypothetical protein F4678DRAFT_143483 [Xylaria arbuscula]